MPKSAPSRRRSRKPSAPPSRTASPSRAASRSAKPRTDEARLERKARKAQQLATPAPGSPPALPRPVDLAAVTVEPAARQVFEREHRTDGRLGVLDALAFLLADGCVDVEADGTCVLFADGFRLPLSPDGRVLAYATTSGGYPLREVRERAAVGRVFDSSPLTPAALCRVLDDDGIDALDVHHSAVDPVDALVVEPFFAEDIRDALALALDVLQDALEDGSAPRALSARSARAPRASVGVPGSYAWLPDGCHELCAAGWTLTLSPDGATVTAAAFDE